MDVELRAVTEDELDEFVLADGYGFGFRWGVDESEEARAFRGKIGPPTERL